MISMYPYTYLQRIYLDLPIDCNEVHSITKIQKFLDTGIQDVRTRIQALSQELR